MFSTWCLKQLFFSSPTLCCNETTKAQGGLWFSFQKIVSWDPRIYRCESNPNIRIFKMFINCSTFSWYLSKKMPEVTFMVQLKRIVETHFNFRKIRPSGAHYYFCFDLSLILEPDLEYQYTPVWSLFSAQLITVQVYGEIPNNIRANNKNKISFN